MGDECGTKTAALSDNAAWPAVAQARMLNPGARRWSRRLDGAIQMSPMLSELRSVRRMRDQVTQTSDIEARELRKGDDLFGAGEVVSAVWVGGSCQVWAGGTTFTFWPDEVVTVRRSGAENSQASPE